MWRKRRIGERISNGRSIAERLGRDRKKKLNARSVAERFDRDPLKKTNVEQDRQFENYRTFGKNKKTISKSGEKNF